MVGNSNRETQIFQREIVTESLQTESRLCNPPLVEVEIRSFMQIRLDLRSSLYKQGSSGNVMRSEVAGMAGLFGVWFRCAGFF